MLHPTRNPYQSHTDASILALITWIKTGPSCLAMNWSPRLLGCTLSPCNMALVIPAARETSAMVMGDWAVSCCFTQAGICVLTASMVLSLQLVGMSLLILSRRRKKG